jgi:hypothetical protein
MEDYWREYRKIEVELSRSKKDLSHNLDRHWITAIKETMDETVKKIIYCIGITALINQARRFGLPVDDIIVQCAIS